MNTQPYLFGCTGKRPFVTIKEARRAIRDMPARGKSRVYNCRHMPHFHVTTMKKREVSKHLRPFKQ